MFADAIQASLEWDYVKRVLGQYGYAPDKQEQATQTVLEHAELIFKDWADVLGLVEVNLRVYYVCACIRKQTLCEAL